LAKIQLHQYAASKLSSLSKMGRQHHHDAWEHVGSRAPIGVASTELVGTMSSASSGTDASDHHAAKAARREAKAESGEINTALLVVGALAAMWLLTR
jgi:hypothetical protein